MPAKTTGLARFIKFGVAGVTVTITNLCLLAFFNRHFAPNLAFVLAYLPSIAVHFLINKYWTFGCDRRDIHRQTIQYAAVVATNFTINWTLYNLVLLVLPDHPVLANLFAIPPTMFLGYILFSRHVFVGTKA